MYRLRGFGAVASPAVSAALSSAADKYGIPPALLNSVALHESSYNPNAVSSAGAEGLLQLMPATAASLGVTNPFDPAQNADAGARYLSQLYNQYGDWPTALIAYNEGPGNLAQKGVFPSSQSYADSILADSGILASSSTDTGAVFDPGMSVDTGGSGLSTGAWVGLGIAALAIVWALG